MDIDHMFFKRSQFTFFTFINKLLTIFIFLTMNYTYGQTPTVFLKNSFMTVHM